MAYRDSTSNAGSGTSLVVTAPTGIQNDDILVAAWVNGGFDGGTITWPAGFTEFVADGSTSGPNSQTFRTAWKRASGESGNYTIESDINDFCAAAITVHSGRHTTDPPVAVATVDTGSAASPVSAAATGVTAVAGDDIVYVMIQNASSDPWAHTSPASYTEREEAGPGNWVSMSVSDRENVSGGATGTITGTLTAAGESGGYAVFVVRIPAAAGGGGSTPRNMLLLGVG